MYVWPVSPTTNTNTDLRGLSIRFSKLMIPTSFTILWLQIWLVKWRASRPFSMTWHRTQTTESIMAYLQIDSFVSTAVLNMWLRIDKYALIENWQVITILVTTCKHNYWIQIHYFDSHQWPPTKLWTTIDSYWIQLHYLSVAHVCFCLSAGRW